jgi:hypothetical protein
LLNSTLSFRAGVIRVYPFDLLRLSWRGTPA